MTDLIRPRVKYVIGPDGSPLTIADLPPTNTRRWVIRRKAEVVAAVRGGLLTFDDACDRYKLTSEEFAGCAGPGCSIRHYDRGVDSPECITGRETEAGGWKVGRPQDCTLQNRTNSCPVTSVRTERRDTCRRGQNLRGLRSAGGPGMSSGGGCDNRQGGV